MGKTFDELNERLIEFIEAQQLFFVASAPTGAGGHVNLSPKGLDSLAVLDAQRIAYIDLGGSGIETQAHVQENGRLCVMFCSFEGAPLQLTLGTLALSASPLMVLCACCGQMIWPHTRLI